MLMAITVNIDVLIITLMVMNLCINDYMAILFYNMFTMDMKKKSHPF